MRPPRECISPNAYPLSHHQRPGCSSQERVLPCHVSAAPGRAPGRPHELYAVDPIQQAAHPWPDVYLQQLHLLRQQGGGCLPPYHTPAGGEPDTLASSPLARQGPRPGPRPGKPLRVWRPERRGDLSPSLSTCPPPGPVGCGVPWVPAHGSASPGGKKGQALACQLRSHWYWVRAQGPSAGACPLGLPSWVFQLDFGISLLWLGLEDTDRAYLHHVTQRPPH